MIAELEGLLAYTKKTVDTTKQFGTGSKIDWDISSSAHNIKYRPHLDRFLHFMFDYVS